MLDILVARSNTVMPMSSPVFRWFAGLKMRSGRNFSTESSLPSVLRIGVHNMSVIVDTPRENTPLCQNQHGKQLRH